MEADDRMPEFFSKLNAKIDRINRTIEGKTIENSHDDRWLDNQAVCQLLNISKRTLQSYRNLRIFPYTRIRNKIYYRWSDIDKRLSKNYRGAK